MSRREDDFEARIAPPRSDRIRGGGRFTTRVVRMLSKASGGPGLTFGPPLARRSRAGPSTGRGRVAARMLRDALGPRARRVVVKARLVLLRQAGARSTATHLRYITREGIARGGEPGRAYGPATDDADLAAFEARGREDRHQFRFIVAPEDAATLENLQAFTRDLMQRVEADLGTRLDWVAVDHWDTDNPHTHIVLRGKDEMGKDLVIAREYVSHGMRQRAGALATEWLGPRTEREIEAAISREVGQERWTDLDRQLQRVARDDLIEVSAIPRSQRVALIGRLQRLQELGLAERQTPGTWRLRRELEPTLRSLGERGDIVRAMQRAVGNEREIVVHTEVHPTLEVVGRVAAAAFVDELTERATLFIDGTDGRAHAVPLPADAKTSHYPLGAIVRAGGQPRPSSADPAIAALAREGIYCAAAQAAVGAAYHPDETVRMHVRRLEALRRAGIVERIADGMWRVPPDVIERGHRHDLARAKVAGVEILSRVSIERQVRAIAATWLDEQFQARATTLSPAGFGAEVRNALQRRGEFLTGGGYACRGHDGSPVITAAALARLRSEDVRRAARRLEAETGLTFRDPKPSESIKGRYRQALWLASGRFAMLDQGDGFSLVPWRPVLEGRIGQSVSVMVSEASVDWALGRERSPGR